jgi:hypothetical protein
MHVNKTSATERSIRDGLETWDELFALYTPCLLIAQVAAYNTSDNAEQSMRCELRIYLVLLIALSLVYVRSVDIQHVMQTRSHDGLSGLMPSSEQ